MKAFVTSIGACLIAVFATAGIAADADQVASKTRFDIHRSGDAVVIVARGIPEQPTATLRKALEARAAAVCASPVGIDEGTVSTYGYLSGGSSFLMPAGGAFLSMTAPNVVHRAPLITRKFSCPSTSAPPIAQPDRPLRIFVHNALGNTIAYVDQGFASFNGAQLDVAVDGESIAERITDAILTALQERGFAVERASTRDVADLEFVVTKEPTPGERFGGMTLMTKIGLLGIDKFSISFNTIRLSMRSTGAQSPAFTAAVNTQNKIDAIYNDWKRDMANGPPSEVHSKISTMLLEALTSNVKSLIHAVPGSSVVVRTQEPAPQQSTAAM